MTTIEKIINEEGKVYLATLHASHPLYACSAIKIKANLGNPKWLKWLIKNDNTIVGGIYIDLGGEIAVFRDNSISAVVGQSPIVDAVNLVVDYYFKNVGNKLTGTCYLKDEDAMKLAKATNFSEAFRFKMSTGEVAVFWEKRRYNGRD